MRLAPEQMISAFFPASIKSSSQLHFISYKKAKEIKLYTGKFQDSQYLKFHI